MNIQHPFPVPKHMDQINGLGFTDTVHKLLLRTIVNTIKRDHGDIFYDAHFAHKNPAEVGTVLQALLAHNLLRKKTLTEITQSEEFLTTISMIKNRDDKIAWDLASISKNHGEKVLKYVFTNGIEITLGDWPDDFTDIVPGHNQFPAKAQFLDNTPMIKIQRVGVLNEESFFNSFDTVYMANKHTKLFSKVFNGDLCSAPKQAEGTYVRGLPGCWWLVQSVFLNKAGLPITTPLDQEKVQEVNYHTSFKTSTL